jgi:hypothetical protein
MDMNHETRAGRVRRSRGAHARALCGLALTLGALLNVPAARGEDSAIDPRASATLHQAVTYLRSLPVFGVHAEVTRDEIVHDDFRLQRTSSADVTVRKPDRMRAELRDSQGARLFVYDGKDLTIYAKDEQYFAVMPAPNTLRETLDYAADHHDVELPLLDIVYLAVGGELNSQVTAAGVIGVSTVDGVECEQLGFRGRKVDWQVWVERGKRPLIRKLVITTRDGHGSPQYGATLRWDLAPKAGEERFAFVPPAGALPIALASGALAEHADNGKR